MFKPRPPCPRPGPRATRALDPSPSAKARPGLGTRARYDPARRRTQTARPSLSPSHPPAVTGRRVAGDERPRAAGSYFPDPPCPGMAVLGRMGPPATVRHPSVITPGLQATIQVDQSVVGTGRYGRTQQANCTSRLHVSAESEAGQSLQQGS